MYSISQNTILLFLCVESSVGVIITSQSKQNHFPTQSPNYANPRTFFRDGELVWCPEGYLFDAKQLFCVKQEIQSKETSVLKPNPENCGTFFSCDGIHCHFMKCPSGLTFNDAKKYCDYPQEANCCEYKAKNPDVLIPPEFSQPSNV
ncbi:uncharacterized protein LOC123011127 [Tribolium madens]|uniref:uncharacterized protein LOC123011127 n=1 Tax=Tribolium madens TaxID=41895 RepID=UPI001CF71EE2|nr:uncharacterized protein LOC123011127 [Tribolium madens]